LLRPSIALTHADGAPAARLGGDPALPTDASWPVWQGHGPLTFVGSVDLAALPQDVLDIPLPAAGTLLLFYFDGQLDGGEALVLGPENQAGARVIYVPQGAAVAERQAPEGVKAYPVVPLTARLEATFPAYGQPELETAFLAPGQEPGALLDHPICSEVFTDALDAFSERVGGCGHRIGGYADFQQGPVELEIASESETHEWVLLAQIDSDHEAGMMWGDVGTLYWLIRRDDLATAQLDAARFTWQCG
jgi:uncharacterized protein YwqG